MKHQDSLSTTLSTVGCIKYPIKDVGHFANQQIYAPSMTTSGSPSWLMMTCGSMIWRRMKHFIWKKFRYRFVNVNRMVVTLQVDFYRLKD